MPTVPWRLPAALAALRLGEPEEAHVLASEHLELARRWGTATEIGGALRVLARIDRKRRLDLLVEAISTLERSPARLELGRALVDQGEALRVARHREAAHEPLRRAAELAAHCGSRVLHTRAHDSLAALGDKPRTRMFSGQESLTASERRVAQLALEGRTNRDIAQELFITPKTVENHLGRVYIKLGITSRRQLSSALG
jgi:DNA-binding CsgD family transcriptional regulator